jgi:DNA polymerase III subunit epsilon
MLRWLKSGLRRQGQADSLPGETPLDAVRYVVLDTELTSLDQRSNRVLSIGAIAMDGSRIQLGQQFYRTMNPGVAIPADSVVIHRLRAVDLEGCEESKTVLEELACFVAGAVLVGHFVKLDVKALWKELGDNRHVMSNPTVDTARVHDWILRHGRYSEDLAIQVEQQDLVTLARFYNLEVEDAHHALADAFLTARLWQKMMSTVQSKGIRTLRDLLKIARG